MNHPLPPKPPVSKYFFHAYIPRVPCVRDLGTLAGNSTTRRIDRGECLPVNSGPKFSSGHQPSPIETNCTPLAAEILPSGEAASEVPEAGPSSSKDPTGANHDDGHVILIPDEGERCVPDVTRLENCTVSYQSAEQQLPRPGIQHSTESTRLDPAGRKRLTSAALETEIETSGPQTRAKVRAKARAEASHCFPVSRRIQPYSTAEDDLFRKLVVRGLPWEQVQMEFSQVFTGRNVRSL
ncbi:hypothetical protein EYZ11_007214 [Aspergillus tanneri]|uniref:Myb-like domain-containing protein n=1 Tax=Aspergillus tanneri TaxID=1220188 RepID=A0A4S3JDH4_9EURO|nr:uncharacterized protein ATNIH1004_011395 [Aspergillus tanneri]KAA8642451.1 hypothetical protein ATNIH1004_011395 [Aspergillus tanneri]THC93289.1 hypothetical protein EYZ11_007214 [Aspergillus tanneri]